MFWGGGYRASTGTVCFPLAAFCSPRLSTVAYGILSSFAELAGTYAAGQAILIHYAEAPD